MTVFQILVLALVQGVTEFLPVSSSAHLILAHEWLGWGDPGQAMDVAVHVGSLLAVMAYFRREIGAMISGAPVVAFQQLPGHRLLLWLSLATIPLVIAGAVFAGFIAENLRSPVVIAWASIGFGLALWAADALGRGRGELLRRHHVAAMALAQALALIPGTSRSGITITAGLAAGLTRQAASRFAFLMAIPALAAAGVYSSWQLLAEDASAAAWGQLALAVAASALGAWLCIGAFLKLVDRIGMLPFVIYRIVLGVGILLMAS